MAAAWEDEDGGIEQRGMKELGKVSSHGSLNLSTPVSSSLGLEGHFFYRLALKAFQNFAMWGKYLRPYVISLPPPMLFGHLTLAPEENGREQMIMF